MEFESFSKSCRDAASYPKNLLHPSAYDHELKAYSQGLTERHNELFTSDPSETEVNIIGFDERQRREFML